MGKDDGSAVGTGEYFVGTVKEYDETNQCGLITSEEVSAKYGQDAFVLSKDIPQDLRAAGTIVYFECGAGSQGPMALNVQSPDVLNEPPAKKLKICDGSVAAGTSEASAGSSPPGDTPSLAEFGASLGIDMSQFASVMNADLPATAATAPATEEKPKEGL
uniref:Uncharacterized protein n=1 Tax=Noctiluca scintillans TaxID=2966 RepID=A0A7S1AE25_NOCSC